MLFDVLKLHIFENDTVSHNTPTKAMNLCRCFNKHDKDTLIDIHIRKNLLQKGQADKTFCVRFFELSVHMLYVIIMFDNSIVYFT